ncbi:pilus assembly protein [Sulfuriferula thiophila]|uniref:pilus assembly protein n=1 Tax=Sulfuriferula thiophila TaxID=1781211 RepID=UPI0016794C64|nr:PilC/PilY family type IV pilus protein [Sulfuriferula thiophila]
MGLSQNSANAASTDIANVPMAVKNSVTPNLLLIYDNSESMDAYMAGTMVSGNNPNTRGNIGRSVMRDAIDSYRTAFNWGLMTYETKTPAIYNTYAYYLGSDGTGTGAGTGMLFTDTCTGYVAPSSANSYVATPGIDSTNGNLKCLANPQPFTGGNYVTYNQSGDDANILDVLYFDAYTSGNAAAYTSLWGLSQQNSASPTNYDLYTTHKTSSGNSWATNAFSGSVGGGTFTATDAGFLSSYLATPPVYRQLYLPRGWGYLADITGAGKLNEPIQTDSSTHYNNLIAKLSSETDNKTTSEIKNAAVFTPLQGTLNSAKSYFATAYQDQNSPIAYSCQQNFVMLVTDGLPTGKTDGTMYSDTERTNTCTWSTTTNSCTSGSFGTAATDAINAVSSLRTTSNSHNTSPYDIQTYVVALGDTVANANALSVMNAMAYNGGTNSALLASDTATLNSAINAITTDITAKVGASAAVAVANAHVTSTNNATYTTNYNSGTWTGDLNAYPIDINTGTVGTTSLWASGSAQYQLDSRTSANRFIATSTDAAGAIGGIAFQSTALSSTQLTLLNTPSVSPVDGTAVLAYLRGDTSGETSGTYRARAHLLGDLVNAEPLVAPPPSANYADSGYMGTSTTFKEANATRTTMVYQGSNDGMLHGFNASTGAELWAYVPNLVMANLNNLSSKSNFTHKYYVDGTPALGDVDFRNTDGATGANTPNWHSIIVGGLGKGGRGYYALDVTTPTATSESAVASKVLWEFPNSAGSTTVTKNTGYSFGKPVIVKTAADGWVVLVTSGYNNGTNSGDSGGDGLGHLFVLNPKTGALIKDIPTTGCTGTPTSNPCGLAQISAYVANPDQDMTTDYVYGGDLMGNVWRFDLSGSVSQWSVAKLAVLKDSSGATQPITTTPELSSITINGAATRFVYVGTGQYLGDSDVPSSSSPNSHATQTQTIYGLLDNLTSTLTDPVRSVLQQQTLTINTNGTSSISNNTVDYTTKKGWYVDFPTTGERINTDPALVSNVLAFTSNIPSTTICVPGGSSWLYYLDYQTGGTTSISSTTTLADGTTATWNGGLALGSSLASRPIIIQLPSGQINALIRKSDGTTISPPVPVATSSATKGRVSWREILE